MNPWKKRPLTRAVSPHAVSNRRTLDRGRLAAAVVEAALVVADSTATDNIRLAAQTRTTTRRPSKCGPSAVSASTRKLIGSNSKKPSRIPHQQRRYRSQASQQLKLSNGDSVFYEGGLKNDSKHGIGKMEVR